MMEVKSVWEIKTRLMPVEEFATDEAALERIRAVMAEGKSFSVELRMFVAGEEHK